MKRKLIFGGICVLVLAMAAGSYVFLRRSDGYRCPESYASKEDYVNDVAKYIKDRLKQNPEVSIETLIAERKVLMDKHHCTGIAVSTSDLIDMSSTASESAAVVTGLRPRTISPTDKTIAVRDIMFGPYELAFSNTSKVHSAYYQGGDQEWLILNFYVPGVWSSKSFDAQDVATFTRDSLGTNVYYSFQAPDPSNGLPAYYVIAFVEDKEAGSTAAYVIKIGVINGTPYSVVYGHEFADSGNSKGEALGWITGDGQEYFRQIGAISPSKEWLKLLR